MIVAYLNEIRSGILEYKNSQEKLALQRIDNNTEMLLNEILKANKLNNKSHKLFGFNSAIDVQFVKSGFNIRFGFEPLRSKFIIECFIPHWKCLRYLNDLQLLELCNGMNELKITYFQNATPCFEHCPELKYKFKSNIINLMNDYFYSMRLEHSESNRSTLGVLVKEINFRNDNHSLFLEMKSVFQLMYNFNSNLYKAIAQK